MGNVMANIRSKFRIEPLPPESSMKNWGIWVSTWFGSGRLRPAPGTMGSLAAIPFGMAIQHFGGPGALAMAAMAIICIGIVAANRYSKKSGVVDDQTIVVDEVAGMWIAAIPAETHWDLWVVAFLLFRLFDIWKPWPASYFDNKSVSGTDVMMDDVVAGIYAMVGVASLATVTYM